jgi:sortase A
MSSFFPSPVRVLAVVGKVLIGAGLILLLFAAYQVFGTTLQEEHTQAGLQVTLDKNAEIRHALAEVTALDKLPKGPPVLAPTTAAPSEGSALGEIRIPRINLSQVVVEGTNTDDLRKGPGHYIGTPLPGQFGNSAIAGHRTTYGHPFYNLDSVKKGDPIVLVTDQGIFVYDAIRSEVVSPNDTAVISNKFGAFITLTTCNPRYSASTRLIVTGKLAHSQLFPNSGLPAGHAAKIQSNGLAGDSTGNATDSVGWGFLWIVVGGLILYFANRYRQWRWWIYSGGVIVELVLLYYFFTAVTPLLPASF